MAKALLVCYRTPHASGLDGEDIEKLRRRLYPANIAPPPAAVARTPGAVSVLFDPGPAARLEGASITLGAPTAALQSAADSCRSPAGCFALLRIEPAKVELLADAAATRTVWYAFSADRFVASTSQRAIVAALGDFELDREACAWMLSSGTLGPGRGWDSRLACVNPDERVALDRNRWTLHRRRADTERVASRDNAPAEPRRLLESSVDHSVRALDIEWPRWVIPLSGGVDSRGVLLSLHRNGTAASQLRCVTWGRTSAERNPLGDAHVAKAVAERLSVPHAFLSVNPLTTPLDRLLDLFLTAGEGRIATLSSYLDGFELWKALAESGVKGIIRGDEAFGWKSVGQEWQVRESVRMTTLDDLLGPGSAAARELPEQKIPDELHRRPAESLEHWRDRLYRQFRLTCMLSALTDLKTSYVEVLNPLLSANVLAQARRLPDDLRTNKRLWRELVRSWLPDVPFAKEGAVAPLRRALREGGMLELILDELESDHARRALGPRAGAFVRAKLEAERSTARRLTYALTPRWASKAARGIRRRALARPEMDPFVLGFRALIAARMTALLEEDARMFARPRPDRRATALNRDSADERRVNDRQKTASRFGQART